MKDEMIKHALVQDYGQTATCPSEFHAVAAVLRDRGVAVTAFTTKRLRRRQLRVTPTTTLVVGDHDTMRVVWKLLLSSQEGTEDTGRGCSIPFMQPLLRDESVFPTDSYPPPLHGYMGRWFYQTSPANLIKRLRRRAQPRQESVFVKPRYHVKQFPGTVVEHWRSVANIVGRGRSSRDDDDDDCLYVSQVVDFVREYRVFVLRGHILGTHLYRESDEDTDHGELDRSVVEAAVQDLEASSYRTVAYALDFGVVVRRSPGGSSTDAANHGQTLLVEWNDAYALGSYGLPATLYTDMLVERWKEIVTRLSQAVAQQSSGGGNDDRGGGEDEN